MPPPPSDASRDEPVIRERGDACPGALRLHAADDGFLARVRIPAGLLGVRQAGLLADAADQFGDGQLELTSRGNVQLRGLADGCVAALAGLLDEAGLLPAPGHERIRNIVAGPLSAPGDPQWPHVRPWALELDRLLCANTRVTALSGRFLFAFDDGRGDVAALGPDITVLGRPQQRALLRTGAAADGVEVAAADAARAALIAAEYFLDAAEAAGTRAWRVRELPPEHGLAARELADRLEAAGIAAEPVGTVDWPRSGAPRPGVARDGSLCALVPLGRLTSGQLRLLARAAAERGGELLITPWRSVVLPPGAGSGSDAGTGAGSGVADDLVRGGLVVAGGSDWQGVTACTGRPGCAKALADVRADAAAVAPRSRGPLPVHWSGCERRCGHPQGTAWVDLVATGGGYELAVHGQELSAAPASVPDLAAALAAARATPAPGSAGLPVCPPRPAPPAGPAGTARPESSASSESDAVQR
ncbi:cobalamin biosynthesis protein CobG [Streptomyces bambusae]|uniref:cobalamin biosynthesis protein CobG n=1 Tax=Streptomyces bambusae TaxID=1550616 RepID=UPI001CFCC9B3|nr:cobalamin biosynthesis protein CobG [Streptomyces bambusae]MCB5168797.1 cobalamin biosynthesis protein CobG [Streptomyces bambusae]